MIAHSSTRFQCAALQLALDDVQGIEADGGFEFAIAVVRGEARADSDIDVLVELDGERALGIFQYARLRLTVNEILYGAIIYLRNPAQSGTLEASEDGSNDTAHKGALC